MTAPSRVRRIASTLTALSVIFSTASLAFSAAPAGAAGGSPLGVYVGAAKPSRVSDFNQWLGRDVTWAMDYFSGESWETIESPNWWIDSWAGTPYKMVWSIPMLPDNTGTLEQGATGAYNNHFENLAELLVARGQGDSVLRIGWEMNGNWFRWAASKNPGAFVDYWREIVTTMRSVPGANFKFDWCPNGGPTDMPADRVYPGDAYVDFIGQDSYDAWWGGESDATKRWTNNLTQPYGLQWQREFAKTHDKPMSFAEWGLWLRDDGYGGGDAPYYIQKMHDWISNNDVAFAIYFEYDGPDGEHRLSNNQFPKAAAKFIDLFGGSAPEPDPEPSPSNTPAPAPSNTPAPAPSNTPAPEPTSPAEAPGGGAPGSDTPSPSPSETSSPTDPVGGIVGGPAPAPNIEVGEITHEVRLCGPCLVRQRQKAAKIFGSRSGWHRHSTTRTKGKHNKKHRRGRHHRGHHNRRRHHGEQHLGRYDGRRHDNRKAIHRRDRRHVI